MSFCDVQELIVMRPLNYSCRSTHTCLVVINAELKFLTDSLLIGEVPEFKAKCSCPSLKPMGSYISDILKRLKFLQERMAWINNGKPVVFWLLGSYFTQVCTA